MAVPLRKPFRQGELSLVPFRRAVDRMDWRQGEHVTLIGPTGRGKTELLINLIDSHPWAVFLGTKQTDSTQTKLTAKLGFRMISDPALLNPEVGRRFLFKPPFPKASAAALKAAHREAFREVLMRAYRQQAWTIAADELRYVYQYLGLQDEILLLYLQGRSQGSSIIAGTQRPRFVPLEAFDQPTHLFFWSDPDRENLNRVAEIAPIDRRLVLATVPKLAHHDVLYVNTVTREAFITNTRW